MQYLKKGFTLIELLVVIAIIGILATIVIVSANDAKASTAGCGGWFEPSCTSQQAEKKQAQAVQENLMQAVPIPQLQTSLERENVSKRAQIFNTPDKISYIYLVDYGKVMAFYTVKGKVSSMQSYMVPTERLVRGSGNPCTGNESVCNVVSAPDIDGTYGENIEGIFFFTTEGAYVEWRGNYMMSDQPLKLATPPALVREIQ